MVDYGFLIKFLKMIEYGIRYKISIYMNIFKMMYIIR